MNTNLFKFLLVISTFLTLSGCGTFISANINSSIDPSFTPRINNRIVIVSKDYKSAYYLPILKEALVNRGFSDISISQSNSMSYGYDLTVVLDVGRQLSEATKTVQDYGVVGQDVDWGETKCKTTNNGLTGERMRCKTGETKVKNIYGVTGTREEKTTNLSRSISLVFSHGSNNKTIMSAIGTSSEDDYTCSDSGIYKALIIYTTKRLSFSVPVNYNYTVEIPEGYSCETVAEYERSLITSAQEEERKYPVVKNRAMTKTPAPLDSDITVTQYKRSSGYSSEDTIRYNNGDIYIGAVINGKPDGIGTYSSFIGKSCMHGRFEAGKRLGEALLLYKNGKKYRGYWRESEAAVDDLREINVKDEFTIRALKNKAVVNCINKL